MAVTIRAELIGKGYVFDSAEYRKAYKAEAFKRLSPEVKRKKWARQARARHARAKEDPIKIAKLREYDKIRKQKLRETQKDLINEKQRRNYALGGAARRKLINDGKKRRDPTIGLASIIKDVRAGRRSARDLADATRDTLDKCSALLHRRT